MSDLFLAVGHHVLVFGLTAMLAMELASLRGDRIDIGRLARLDAGYGATAGLILIVGVCRVIWGGKGWAFYEANPFFWAKLATFGLIGLISIAPTRRILRWARIAKADPGFAPDATAVAAAARLVRLELLLLVPLVGFAAAMARWPF